MYHRSCHSNSGLDIMCYNYSSSCKTGDVEEKGSSIESNRWTNDVRLTEEACHILLNGSSAKSQSKRKRWQVNNPKFWPLITTTSISNSKWRVDSFYICASIGEVGDGRFNDLVDPHTGLPSIIQHSVCSSRSDSARQVHEAISSAAREDPHRVAAAIVILFQWTGEDVSFVYTWAE